MKRNLIQKSSEDNIFVPVKVIEFKQIEIGLDSFDFEEFKKDYSSVMSHSVVRVAVRGRREQLVGFEFKKVKEFLLGRGAIDVIFSYEIEEDRVARNKDMILETDLKKLLKMYFEGLDISMDKKEFLFKESFEYVDRVEGM